MSEQPKIVSVEKGAGTLGDLQAKRLVAFKTRELAGFLKYVHDTIAQNDVNRAKDLIAGFLTELAQSLK
ncbi:MAG: hypothetical protein HWN66_07350 [Candidatus Helarchaeota archaeon]|nr:hypothetical protein [Candidatus Helarchaeota archaeon]